MDTPMIDDGGQAFPGAPTLANPAEGMSLRDWFAGKALQGELASQSEDTGTWSERAAEELAQLAYCYADAMIQARKG